jgi:alpha-1,2-mannosyltransferase
MIIVYTGDYDCTVEKIVDIVHKRFTIKMDATRLNFVYLKTRPLLLDKFYPIFTLLGQSLGSMIVGFEAIVKFVPDIYFETTGYAFTYPIFYYLANIPVCCYVHYPTISVDMLNNVSQRNFAFNNRYLISRSKFLTQSKLFYYKLFSKLYSMCGRCSTCIMVNSSWTLGHINNLWSVSYRTNIVFPPCDIETFSKIENPKRDDNFFIASVAQFRPEKNHQLQIKSFNLLLEK